MTSCPYCDKAIDHYIDDLKQIFAVKPNPLALCPECGEPLIVRQRVDGSAKVRKPTADEHVALVANPKMVRMRAAFVLAVQTSEANMQPAVASMWEDFKSAGLPGRTPESMLKYAKYCFYCGMAGMLELVREAGERDDTQACLDLVKAELYRFHDEELKEWSTEPWTTN